MSAPLSEDVFHLAAPATEWPLSFIRFPNLPARPWRPVAPSSRRVGRISGRSYHSAFFHLLGWSSATEVF